MKERPDCNKMIASPPAMKTVQDGSQAQGAVKAGGKGFRRVVGRSTGVLEGVKGQGRVE